MRSGWTAGGGRGIATFRLLAILASLLSALVGAFPAAAAVPDLRRSAAPPARVIVEAVDLDGARALVERLGGRPVRPLPIIGGFVAAVPAGSLEALARSPLVRSVSPDRRVSLAGANERAGSAPANPLEEVARQIGVDALWARGLTGAGIDIALIDSGVVPVAGLDNVLHGPDLSFESQNGDLAHLDTFGHGTHLAGIIAGRDAGSGPFRGIAPGARIVSVKVADAFGATDVSQVIAAIDWVVQHRQAHGLNIRVLNLAFGTDSGQAYGVDPLAHAVEVAWHKGIVVVVSAGNRGSAGLTDPAYDPFVISVGAADTTNAAEDGAGATVADWSSRGDGARNPDLVAPGVRVVSLRAPGSFIDEEYPGARVSWPPGDAAGDSGEESTEGSPPDGEAATAPPDAEAEPTGDPPEEPGAPGGEPEGDPPAEPSEQPPDSFGEPTGEPAPDPPEEPAPDPPGEPEEPGETPPGEGDVPADPAPEPSSETPDQPEGESQEAASGVDEQAPRFFRGSGTSQAAAVISGVVALLLEQHRWLKPNKVKALLAATASPLTGDRASEGAGLVDAAATQSVPSLESAWQSWTRSTGEGSLELARGSVHVVDPDGVELAGEQDIFGRHWEGREWAQASLDGRAWSDGWWNGSPWAGSGFSGAFWEVAAWNEPAWSARSWAELAWAGRRWSGEAWTGESWWSNAWAGRRWTSAAWMAFWQP
jgi:hypothetical protein